MSATSPAGVYEVPITYIFNQPDYVKTAKNAITKVTVEITKK